MLEIASISIIILLLLLISGQDVSDSNLYLLFEIIPFEQSVYNISYLMISIVIIKTVFQIIFNYNQEKISYGITKRINVSLFEKFVNSRYIDYINENSPKILRILNQESIRVGNQLISPFITMINEIFLLILIISFIFFYDIYLGLAFCLMSIILLLSFNISVNKIVKKLGEDLAEANTSRIKLISETFKGLDIIKLFNKNEIFRIQFEKMTQKVSDAAFKNLFYLKLPKSIFELVIFLVIFGMIFILSLTNNESLLITYLSVSAVSIYKIIPSLNKLSNAFQAIQYFSTPFKEIVGYLNINQEKTYKVSVEDFINISFKNIDFKYSTDFILKDIDFEINKNDFIGIYGPSGSGKSTFIKLLSGLMNPNNGKILINGKVISAIELRSYCSYVPQDSIILDDDIHTNISLEYQASKIDKEKVIDILKKVDLYEKLKESLDSPLGESGIKISGGQKQRIAIARALYHNKSILILDESTSNLDSETEGRIIDLLKKISAEISIIIVSHKKSSLDKCTAIFEINNKKLNKKL
jgi:ATP-binding cassette subfamily B protein